VKVIARRMMKGIQRKKTAARSLLEVGFWDAVRKRVPPDPGNEFSLTLIELRLLLSA
jgi:hypothetical protein